MKLTLALQLLTTLLAFAAATTRAEFVTVDLTPVANGTVNLLPQSPTRQQTLAQVPFDLLPPSGKNIWNASIGTKVGVRSTQSMVLPVKIEGATAIDTLINTSWGAQDSMTVSVTCICTDGMTFKKLLKAGTDIRDWNEGPFVNKINGTTAVNTLSDAKRHVDKQHIDLPEDFATRTLAYIIVTDSGVTGNEDVPQSKEMQAQRAFVTGITVTTKSK